MPSTLTATTLPLNLLDALIGCGLQYPAARRIVGVLPPAGQHALLTDLRANPDALSAVRQAFIGSVAERLRTTHADAHLIRTLLAPEATR